MSDHFRMLLVGHLSDHVSGSSLSFGMLVKELRARGDVATQLVSTARPPRFTSNVVVNMLTALRVTISVVRELPRADVVSFQASSPAMLSYAPIMALLCRLFGRPLVLRVFGGGLDDEYSRLGQVRKWMFRLAADRAELLLLQTRHLVAHFSLLLKCRTEWFPTSRPLPRSRSLVAHPRSSASRFVFVGRISEQKGIELILDCAPLLAEGIEIDLFGSLDAQYSDTELDRRGGGRVRYRGTLPISLVQETLQNYDALVLPTHYPGEGYPGAIVEAYSCALPVVATKWRAIPEIVTEETGILLDAHTSVALANAINKLNQDTDLFVRLRAGAFAARTLFSSADWTGRFVQMCAQVVRRQPST